MITMTPLLLVGAVRGIARSALVPEVLTTAEGGVAVKPVVVKGRGALRDVNCSVPCRWSNDDGIVSRYVVEGPEQWHVLKSIEGPQYYPELRPPPTPQTASGSQIYMTTSFRSAVPLTYLRSLSRLRDSPVDFDNVTHGASFIARNCKSMNHRESVVKELRGWLPIDGLSSCLHSKTPPTGWFDDIGMHWYNTKRAMMRQYLFYLAFENQNEDDYITEKLWESLASGTVPVYMGSPNVKQHAPAGSIIAVDDFPSTAALGAYLSALARNRTAYDTYHAWRRRPLPQSFLDKYRPIVGEHPKGVDADEHSGQCRLCRYVDARRRGVRWDHDAQRAEERPLESNGVSPKVGLKHRSTRPITYNHGGRSWVASATYVGSKR